MYLSLLQTWFMRIWEKTWEKICGLFEVSLYTYCSQIIGYLANKQQFVGVTLVFCICSAGNFNSKQQYEAWWKGLFWVLFPLSFLTFLEQYPLIFQCRMFGNVLSGGWNCYDDTLCLCRNRLLIPLIGEAVNIIGVFVTPEGYSFMLDLFFRISSGLYIFKPGDMCNIG